MSFNLLLLDISTSTSSTIFFSYGFLYSSFISSIISYLTIFLPVLLVSYYCNFFYSVSVVTEAPPMFDL